MATATWAQAGQSAASLEKSGRLKEASEAYVNEALVQSFDQAQVSVNRAVAINPDLAHLQKLLLSLGTKHLDPRIRAMSYFELGMLDLVQRAYTKARASFRIASQLQSDHWNARYLAIAMGLYTGELDTVRQELDEVFRAGPPKSWFERFVLLSSVWLANEGRPLQALTLLDDQILKTGPAEALPLALGVLFAERIPDRSKADTYLAQLRKNHGSSSLASTFNTAGPWNMDPLFLILGSNLGSPLISTGALAKENLPAQGVPIIQLGMFSKEENARAYKDRLVAKFPSYSARVQETAGKFRVIITIPPGTDADILLLTLKEQGFEGFLSSLDS